MIKEELKNPGKKQNTLNHSIQNIINRPTPLGPIQIQSFCTPDEIQRYRFDPQFTIHAQYKSIYTKQETLVQHAESTLANVVLALTEDRQIVGFGVLSHPNEDDRWAELEPGIMMEIKAIEVSRRFRSCKIAGDLLRLMLSHPTVEQMIAYMVGYSWTWDLDGSGLTVHQYRNMLIHLFSPHQFFELQTNEANICLKPENLFMARVGSHVSNQIRQDFKLLRFGITV